MKKVHVEVKMEDNKNIIEEKYGMLEGPLNQNYGNGPAVYYRIPGFKGKIGFISAISHQFCDSCNRVRLTAEGLLKPCLQYAEGIDLRKAIREGDEPLDNLIRKGIFDKPKEHNFRSSTIDGKEIDPKRIYKVATIDYLAEGNDGMTALTKAVKRHDIGILIQDIMSEYVIKHRVMDSSIEGRIKIKD